ncbi:MAG: CHAT domain-containing protein [Oscillatoriales cyanobacterium C42_A2020_001]|nr:CHAT domain-containing protein [Leptolyngbyaceae cyanobacterium C42_A2020_001]
MQELEDYLRNVRSGGQNLYELPPEQEILKKYNALQKTAIQLGQELTTLRKIPEANRTATQQQQIAQLVKLQADLNQQFNSFTERTDVVALAKQLSPAALRQTVDLTQLDALRNDLRQLNAVLLYPLILEDRLELVITTPDSPPLRRTVNVKRADLNATIVEFRQALKNSGGDAKTPAQKLYMWLIKPLEADLKQANAKTIIYAPDGQLRYIPLQALHDGQQWLVQRYRINNITARSFTEFKTQPITQPRILAGGFVTGQYTFKVGDRQVAFNGLPFAGSEVDTLAMLVPSTKKLIDKLFSRDSTTSQMNEFNIVHLATHASFVPGVATDSFIVFGNGDKATLKDIESWSLNNVDLIVLSACETGLGGKFGNGEEILGLGYQFQNRGAKAAIASLWQVDDGGTQTLMTAFYTALKQGNLTKAAALQQAQIAMITGNAQTNATSDQRSSVSYKPGQSQTASISRNSSHPYYWAPFILIGNGL